MFLSISLIHAMYFYNDLLLSSSNATLSLSSFTKGLIDEIHRLRILLLASAESKAKRELNTVCSGCQPIERG